MPVAWSLKQLLPAVHCVKGPEDGSLLRMCTRDGRLRCPVLPVYKDACLSIHLTLEEVAATENHPSRAPLLKNVQVSLNVGPTLAEANTCAGQPLES